MSDGAAQHPLVIAARRIAAEVLVPAAAEVEASTVPRAQLEALGAVGLCGIAGPASAGGTDAPAPVRREVEEVLAAACAPTWFTWTQHHTPVRLLAATENRPLADRLLADLCAGRRLAGVAFSHLRRPVPGVTATRSDDGWRIDGRLPWVTGWGLIDVLTVAAVTDDERAVFVVAPAREGVTLRPSGLDLAAMRASRTVSVDCAGLHVADHDVVQVVSLSQWRADDALRTTNVVPATFGIARAALDGLAASPVPGAAETASTLAAGLARCRQRAYQLLDDEPADAHLDERLALRAEALDLAVRAAVAYVAASGGRGMSADHAASRLVRTALFMLVQAQTARSRTATLQRLRRPS